jgi:hypothetical protein
MKRLLAGLMLCLLSVSARAANPARNWSAPPSWTPPSSQAAGRGALTVYPPLPFVPIPPCRIIDTRAGSGFPAGYGPPSLGTGAQRSFVIAGQCGIPLGAQAVSFNFAVWVPSTRGDLRVFPSGGAVPVVSTLNWEAGILALANAAVVPLGTNADITVLNDGTAVDIFVDVNGFYGPTAADPTQFFSLVTNSPNFTMSLSNVSVGCSGICGLLQTVIGGTAIEGDSGSTLATDAGVLGTGVAAAGVIGTSTTGTGVEGQTSSSVNDAAGVLGTDGAGAGVNTGLLSAGVRGEGKHGVVGITNTAAGNGVLAVAVAPATVALQANGNFAATGTKAFIEPHPTDPNLTIRYVALEGPEAGTYFRGTAATTDREAVIEVPESFRMVTSDEGLTVQLTPVGQLAQMAVISRDLNRIVVRSSRDVTFDYHVNGTRRAFRDWQAVAAGHEFRPVSPDQKLPGWLTEEARNRLIANGTYNPDGTVNMATAERMGWAQKWRDESARAKLIQEAAAAKPH